MRLLLTSLVVIACCGVIVAAVQPRSSAQAAKPRVSACSLLTKELIRKVTPEKGRALDLLFTVEPDADSTGAGGTDCTYGGIEIQIDPRFSYATYKKQPGWEHAEPVAGLGDEALFHDNIGEWAEMIIRSGSHLLTIRMDIPKGMKAAAIKPNVVMLAKELLPKVK